MNLIFLLKYILDNCINLIWKLHNKHSAWIHEPLCTACADMMARRSTGAWWSDIIITPPGLC